MSSPWELHPPLTNPRARMEDRLLALEERLTALRSSKYAQIHNAVVQGSGTAAWVTMATSELLYADSAKTIPMRLWYTPPVPVWAEVEGNMNVFTSTAAYNWSYGRFRVSPADDDGVVDTYVLATQHNTVDAYGNRTFKRFYSLSPGIAYSFELWWGPASGGTWQVLAGPHHISLALKAYVR